MPGDDLTSIPDLHEVHQRALADKLSIKSLRALADADPRAIYAALGNIRPRPTRVRIAAWQDDSRSRLSGDTIDRSDWHTTASFAVIFAQRQVDGRWERRLEAQQTEVEPEPESRRWPDWDCGALCDWMLGRLGPAEYKAEPEPSAVEPAEAAAAVEPATSVAPAHAGRAELQVQSATIIDALHEQDLISAGNLTAAPPEDLNSSVRLRLTVRGGRSGQQLRAAVWFRRPAGPGWSPQEPVIVPASGQAEFDLSSVPPGEHVVRLLAWATDPGATLAAVTLPKLTFRPEAEQDADPAMAHAGP